MTNTLNPAIVERAAEAMRADLVEQTGPLSPYREGDNRLLYIGDYIDVSALARAALASAIPEAVEAEREACAKFADANADAAAEREYSDLENQAIAIAAAIRARGAEQKGGG
jgi:hypothetical protein